MAERFDVPLLIHVSGGGSAGARFLIQNGHPEWLEDAVLRHPKLRLYIENARFPYPEETVALLYRYPQVYVTSRRSRGLCRGRCFIAI